MTSGEDPGPTGRVQALRGRAEAVAQRARSWVEERRAEQLPMDLAIRFYERDREQFAAVLGAAVALRLFLFLVPAVVTVVGLLSAVLPRDRWDDVMQQAAITGQLAGQVTDAMQTSRSKWFVVFLGGLWLSTWAGRNLALVLAACSSAAWRLDVRANRMTLRAAGTVTLLAFGVFLSASVVSRLRSSFGLAGETTSWIVAAVVMGAAWFAIGWALPRGTRDPGALLPGAALVGLLVAALQWFLQFYLPSKVARASAWAGGTGAAVAVLGSMFVIGRLMASSFILNAVVYERLGSVSELVFSLPGLRRLPRRFPSLARFFDLPPHGGSADRPAG